ncbi:putative outer membrane autotransporter barrel [Synechococcus sp. MVIR-18-1]|nr:putative outer membrane autotransporter barrel [Synechococcus sp. MVIR-18-1]
MNTPWAPNGDSPSLASKYGSYAFLADPAYYTSPANIPSNATYVLKDPKLNSSNGLFYYQNSEQLHYTTAAGSDNGYKVQFYAGEDFSGNCEESGPGNIDDFIDILDETPSDIDAGILSRLRGLSKSERQARLGELVSALLIPRNVIAAGGLATQAFSNDLADTILEQLPTRYLMEVEEEVVVEIDEVETEEEVVPTREPVRGLWMKDGEVDDAQASDYLDKTVIASASQSTDALEIGGINYVEDQDPRSIYLNGGMRAWVKGFAGSMSPFSTGGLEKNGIYYPDVYNDFYSTHGGVVVGVDAPVADKVQVGVFGHYGSISLNQFAGEFTGNGSWNPSGWGGGLTASYVDKGFYVQGLFGATSFSGENKRQVLLGGVIDETYTATKNTTSYVGAVRVGAPVLWVGVIVDPQLTATWNGNNDASYTESGRYDALALKVKSYSDHFLQTALGSKFSWPIPYDNGNLLTPSLRVAWLADWNTNNGDVSYQRANAENPTTAKIPSNQEMENGVLLEGGVDYAIFGGESSSWMLYAKGGAKVWFSKSADWRASGGVTFRF